MHRSDEMAEYRDKLSILRSADGLYRMLLSCNGNAGLVVRFNKPKKWEYDKTELYWEDMRAFNISALQAWAKYNCARRREIEKGMDTLHCVFHIILEYDGKLRPPLSPMKRENLRIHEGQRQMWKKLFEGEEDEEVNCYSKGMNENVM